MSLQQGSVVYIAKTWMKILMLVVVISAIIAVGSVTSAGTGASAGPDRSTDQKFIGTTGSLPDLESSLPRGIEGAVYAHNETLWTASGNQRIQEQSANDLDSALLTNNNHYTDVYRFRIRDQKSVYLLTPFITPVKKDGADPLVRYFWFDLNMPVGVNVTSVSVYSGNNLKYTNSTVLAGTGAKKTYLIDTRCPEKNGTGYPGQPDRQKLPANQSDRTCLWCRCQAGMVIFLFF